MPVQRFRTFDDARRALWCDQGDPDLHRRIARLWMTSKRLAPLCIPRGLRKFRSIAEANREREQWVTDRVRALAAARAPR
jgi:hypothetical protein